MSSLARLLLVALFACCLLFSASAWAEDGAVLTQHYEPADGRVHIDVTVTYTSGGGASYTPYYGIGTARITLPQPTGVTLPTFASTPAEPAPTACKIDKGAYDQDNTGFICNFPGRRQEAEILFPETVTIHLVSTACYPFPDISSRQPARVDVWAAQDVTDGAPDATYAIGSTDPCSVPPPPPAQQVAGTKTVAKTCTVPSLKKQTLKNAKKKLTKAGCKTGKVTKAYSKTVKKGRVISQSVKAKKKVKRGTKVKLKVSKGPKPKKTTKR